MSRPDGVLGLGDGSRSMGAGSISALPGLVLVCALVAWGLPVAAEQTDDLLRALETGPEPARDAAASRLFFLGDSERGVAVLAPLLRSADPSERASAARGLGMLRSRSARAPLEGALDDGDWGVRRDAAEALGQIGDPSAAGALCAALPLEAEPRVRASLARALGELSVPASAQPLSRALSGEAEPEVRLHLVEALSRHAGSPAARRALRRALSDPIESVRLLAAERLVVLGERRGVAPLAARLAASDSMPRSVRMEAASALGGATGRANRPARAALAGSLDDGDPQIDIAAAEALARLGDDRGAERLRSMASGSDAPDVRRLAIEALERIEALPAR